MYRFDFAAYVTKGLFTRIAEALDYPHAAELGRLAPSLARIFSALGGLPLVDRVPSEAERTEAGVSLLSEALEHLFGRGLRAAETGFFEAPSRESALASELQAWPLTDVNRADEAALEALPVIGPAVAKRIVEERARRGRFASLDDLAVRVDGLGKKGVAALRHILVALEPSSSPPRPAQAASDLKSGLKALLALQAPGTPLEQLERGLELLAVEVATRPHPASAAQTRRMPPPPALPDAWVDADWVGVLDNAEYLRVVPEMLRRAKKRIDVCMFHAAAPAPGHPTLQLLEALAQAHGAGASVRVLLDRDQPADPYLSTIVNTPAKKWLAAHGIDCRFDNSHKLLHSKFVVIDDDLVIVGSHNWTAGSYAEFDDLSFAIQSTAYTTQMKARFATLWPKK